MSTQSLVTRIQQISDGLGLPAILSHIQAAQDALYSDDAILMRFVGRGNRGFPPYLLTSAGNCSYEIKSANLSEAPNILLGGIPRALTPNEVKAVFIDATLGNNYGRIGTYQEARQYRPGGPLHTSNERLMVLDVPCHCEPGYGNTAPVVTFYEDPGNTSTFFFVEFTYLPPRITSVNIPLMVSSDFEDAIYCYVRGEIQNDKNGNINEYQNKFETYWKPKFVTKMNGGNQRFKGYTQPEPC